MVDILNAAVFMSSTMPRHSFLHNCRNFLGFIA